MKEKQEVIVSVEKIRNYIYIVRGQQVMVDAEHYHMFFLNKALLCYQQFYEVK